MKTITAYDAAAWARAQPTEFRRDPCLVLQFVQLVKLLSQVYASQT